MFSELTFAAREMQTGGKYVLAHVPYRHPGSQALAGAVRVAAAEAKVLLPENHGVLVRDTDVREALEALEGLETLQVTCRMALTAWRAGPELRPSGSGAPTVSDFRVDAGYRPRRRWVR